MSDPEAHPTEGGRAGRAGDETRYFGFHDGRSRLGGFVQVTTDLALSEALTSLCLWLPDGRTALASQRAPVTVTEALLRTGGTRVRVNDVADDVDVVHDGRAQVLDDPWALGEPVWPTDDVQAPAGPTTGVEARLRWMLGSPPYAPTEGPARLAQASVVAGTVQLGDFVWEVEGRGVRCRRDADGAALARRWSIAAAIDEEFACFATETTSTDGSHTSGFVWESGVSHPVEAMQVDTVLADDRGRPVELAVVLSDGDGRRWRLMGGIQRTAPIESLSGTTALAGLAVWTTEDGRTGPGAAHCVDRA